MQKIKVNSTKWQSKPVTNGTGLQVALAIITQLPNLTRYLVNAQKIHVAHSGLPPPLTLVLQMVVTSSAQEPTPLNNLCDLGHISLASISLGLPTCSTENEGRQLRSTLQELDPCTVLRGVHVIIVCFINYKIK